MGEAMYEPKTDSVSIGSKPDGETLSAWVQVPGPSWNAVSPPGSGQYSRQVIRQVMGL